MYVAPDPKLGAFTCVHCTVYSQQEARALILMNMGQCLPTAYAARCVLCKKWTIWYQDEMIYPKSSNVPMPHPDLPHDCSLIYEEARAVYGVSKRASAALIRLALEHLVRGLCPNGKNINDCIKQLVSNGLPIQIQQAMDVCRVVGNEAVHPGEIDINESPEVAYQLFELVNLIVDNQITQPRKIAEMFEALPESKKEGIKNRDGK